MRHLCLASLLLASTAFTMPGFAQTAPADTPTLTPAAKRPDTAPVGQTASPTDIGRIRTGETVTPGGVTRVDLGGGNMIEEDAPKSRSTVTRDAIDKLSPTANPYQMIDKLPGVNGASADAAGLNGGTITIRGFTSSQIGLTIEGMPVNDSGNYALYPQEYVDAENIQQISIAQGTPDLDSPHVGATGGVINIYMKDPDKKAGGLIDVEGGSHDLERIFGRLETGEIGNVSAYLSVSHYQSNHWAGPGTDDRNHVDAKAVLQVREQSRITASFIYNDAVNNNYVSPTLAQFNTPGFKPSYLANLPASFFTGPDQSANSAANYYKYRVNPFRNAIVSLPSTFALTDNLTYDVIPYVWYGYGNGGGTSTLTEQPVGTTTGSGVFYGNTRLTGIDWNNNGVISTTNKALYYNPSITETWRPGVVNKLTYQWENHKFVAGYWYEAATHTQTAPYAALNADGSVANVFVDSNAFIIPTGIYAGQKLERRDWITKTYTNEVFAGDTWSPTGRLDIDVGIKQIYVTRHLQNLVPGAQQYVNSDNNQTLPSAGIRYKLDPKNQVFASVGTTFRTTPNYALADVFSSTTGARTTLGTGHLAPEQAITAEIGHRYQGEIIATSVSAFGTLYKNRQVTTNLPDPSGGTATYSFNLNAGSVTTYGIDFEAGTRPIFGSWRPYVSAELLNTRLNDNLPVTTTTGAGDYLPTKGKQLPQAPNFSSAIGLDYDDGSIFGNVAYKFEGKQYSSFMNDEAMPAHMDVDTSIGYRFANYGIAKSPEIKLNIFNLFNVRSLTGVNGVQANALPTKGVKGGTVASSGSPSYYMGEGFAAIVTLKAAF